MNRTSAEVEPIQSTGRFVTATLNLIQKHGDYLPGVYLFYNDGTFQALYSNKDDGYIYAGEPKIMHERWGQFGKYRLNPDGTVVRNKHNGNRYPLWIGKPIVDSLKGVICLPNSPDVDFFFRMESKGLLYAHFNLETNIRLWVAHVKDWEWQQNILQEYEDNVVSISSLPNTNLIIIFLKGGRYVRYNPQTKKILDEVSRKITPEDDLISWAKEVVDKVDRISSVLVWGKNDEIMTVFFNDGTCIINGIKSEGDLNITKAPNAGNFAELLLQSISTHSVNRNYLTAFSIRADQGKYKAGTYIFYSDGTYQFLSLNSKMAFTNVTNAAKVSNDWGKLNQFRKNNNIIATDGLGRPYQLWLTDLDANCIKIALPIEGRGIVLFILKGDKYIQFNLVSNEKQWLALTANMGTGALAQYANDIIAAIPAFENNPNSSLMIIFLRNGTYFHYDYCTTQISAFTDNRINQVIKISNNLEGVINWGQNNEILTFITADKKMLHMHAKDDLRNQLDSRFLNPEALIVDQLAEKLIALSRDLYQPKVVGAVNCSSSNPKFNKSLFVFYDNGSIKKYPVRDGIFQHAILDDNPREFDDIAPGENKISAKQIKKMRAIFQIPGEEVLYYFDNESKINTLYLKDKNENSLLNTGDFNIDLNSIISVLVWPDANYMLFFMKNSQLKYYDYDTKKIISKDPIAILCNKSFMQFQNYICGSVVIGNPPFRNLLCFLNFGGVIKINFDFENLYRSSQVNFPYTYLLKEYRFPVVSDNSGVNTSFMPLCNDKIDVLRKIAGSREAFAFYVGPSTNQQVVIIEKNLSENQYELALSDDKAGTKITEPMVDRNDCVIPLRIEDATYLLLIGDWVDRSNLKICRLDVNNGLELKPVSSSLYAITKYNYIFQVISGEVNRLCCLSFRGANYDIGLDVYTVAIKNETSIDITPSMSYLIREIPTGPALKSFNCNVDGVNYLYIHEFSGCFHIIKIADYIQQFPGIDLYNGGFEVPLFPIKYKNKNLLISYRYGSVDLQHKDLSQFGENINAITIREFKSYNCLGPVISYSSGNITYDLACNMIAYEYSNMLFLYCCDKKQSWTAFVDQNLIIRPWFVVDAKSNSAKYLLPGQIKVDCVKEALIGYNREQLKEILNEFIPDQRHQIEFGKTLKLLLDLIGNQMDFDLIRAKYTNPIQLDYINTVIQQLFDDSNANINTLASYQNSFTGIEVDLRFTSISAKLNSMQRVSNPSIAKVVSELKEIVDQVIVNNSVMHSTLLDYINNRLFANSNDSADCTLGINDFCMLLSREAQYSDRNYDGAIKVIQKRIDQIFYVFNKFTLLMQPSLDDKKGLQEFSKLLVANFNSANDVDANYLEVIQSFLKSIRELYSYPNSALFSGWWNTAFDKRNTFNGKLNAFDRAKLLDWFLETAYLFTYMLYTILIQGYVGISLAEEFAEPKDSYSNQIQKTYKLLSEVITLIDGAIPQQLLNYYDAKNRLAATVKLSEDPKTWFILNDGTFLVEGLPQNPYGENYCQLLSDELVAHAKDFVATDSDDDPNEEKGLSDKNFSSIDLPSGPDIWTKNICGAFTAYSNLINPPASKITFLAYGGKKYIGYENSEQYSMHDIVPLSDPRSSSLPWIKDITTEKVNVVAAAQAQNSKIYFFTNDDKVLYSWSENNKNMAPLEIEKIFPGIVLPSLKLPVSVLKAALIHYDYLYLVYDNGLMKIYNLILGAPGYDKTVSLTFLFSLTGLLQQSFESFSRNVSLIKANLFMSFNSQSFFPRLASTTNNFGIGNDSDDTAISTMVGAGIDVPKSLMTSLPPSRESAGDIPKKSFIMVIKTPGLGSCLFWSTAMALLLPVIHDDKNFSDYYKKLFGNMNNIDHCRALLRKFDDNNPAIVFEDPVLKQLVTIVFRQIIIEYIYAHKTKFEQFFSKNEDGNQKFELYLNGMKMPTAEAGEIEIRAIREYLSVNIIVEVDNERPSDSNKLSLQYTDVKGFDPSKPTLNLVYTKYDKVLSRSNNHYNFKLDSAVFDPKKLDARTSSHVMK